MKNPKLNPAKIQKIYLSDKYDCSAYGFLEFENEEQKQNMLEYVLQVANLWYIVYLGTEALKTHRFFQIREDINSIQLIHTQIAYISKPGFPDEIELSRSLDLELKATENPIDDLKDLTKYLDEWRKKIKLKIQEIEQKTLPKYYKNVF